MITALDSSVIWAIIKREPGHESWLEALMEAASEGPLLVSSVVFAELAPSTSDETELLEFLGRLSIGYEPISLKAG